MHGLRQWLLPYGKPHLTDSLELHPSAVPVAPPFPGGLSRSLPSRPPPPRAPRPLQGCTEWEPKWSPPRLSTCALLAVPRDHHGHPSAFAGSPIEKEPLREMCRVPMPQEPS